MKYSGSSLVACAALLVSACSSEPEAPAPQDDAAATPAANEAAAPAEAAAGDAQAIPAGMQGRWGLTAADCEPGGGDPMGLVTIDAGTIRFYESLATLGSVEEYSPDRLRGTFGFEGEGMTWQLDMLLELDGDTLVRTEFGDEARPEPSTYIRCK